MMNVIFLDIDGVLNNEHTKEVFPNRFIYKTVDGELKKYRITGVKPQLVKLLLDWASKRDIHFVLSSTWRLTEDSHQYLRQHGLDWLMTTPDMFEPDYIRGKEIQAILDYGFIDKYAILDDFHGGYFLKHQLPFLVQTSPVHGLRQKNLDKLDGIFYGEVQQEILKRKR